MNELLDLATSQRLKKAQNILIASHIRPDGDAIGSALGLGLALQQAGKGVQVVLADGVPSSFRHLPGTDMVVKRANIQYDMSVVVDCSDLERTGGAMNGVVKPDLIVDHHITNLDYGVINLVDPEAVATCAILASRLPAWGFPITPPVAAALLTGVVSDTLGFRTSNMTPEALRLAAILMECGANLPDLYQRTLTSHSFIALRYWAQGLSSLKLEGRLVWTSLTLADRAAAEYYGNDDADLVNLLSTVEEADVAVIFIEQKSARVKVSWRSQPGVDVSKIAVLFGGGGHPAASGVEINGQLEEVQTQVLEATRSLLKQNGK